MGVSKRCINGDFDDIISNHPASKCVLLGNGSRRLKNDLSPLSDIFIVVN
jgi:hypothetical protein